MSATATRTNRQLQKNGGRADGHGGQQQLSPRAVPSAFADVQGLQCSVGNRAMHCLLQGEGPPVAQSALNSSGQPLDPTTRGEMEALFGEDFQSVRIHSNQVAADSAELLRARAYTFGEHVVFGANLFSPNASDGRRLLAHELSHVVQQRNGAGSPSQHANAEDEAKQAAENAASGQPVSVQSTGTGAIQMDEQDDDPVLRKFMQDQQRKVNPPMGSKDWVLRFKGASAVTPDKAQASSVQFQTPGATVRGDERAHKPPIPATMMPLLDKSKLRDFAQGQQDAKKKEREERSLGPAGPTEKRRALAGSPILALQEAFEAEGYGAGADIGPLRQAFLSLSPAEFLSRYPRFTLNEYELLRDYFQIGTRPWTNYIPPEGKVDVSIRKMLKLSPGTYISQDRLDKLADVLVDKDQQTALSKETGVSREEQQDVYKFLNRTGRVGRYIEKNPAIAVAGYASIRQSQYDALVRQQRMEDIQTIAQSGLAGVGYVASIPFTDTHEQRMTVARIGALAEAGAGLAAGTVAARQQMKTAGQSVSPADRPAITAPANVQRPTPPKGLAGSPRSASAEKPNPPNKPPSTSSIGLEAIELGRGSQSPSPAGEIPLLTEGEIPLITPPTRRLPPKGGTYSPAGPSFANWPEVTGRSLKEKKEPLHRNMHYPGYIILPPGTTGIDLIGRGRGVTEVRSVTRMERQKDGTVIPVRTIEYSGAHVVQLKTIDKATWENVQREVERAVKGIFKLQKVWETDDPKAQKMFTTGTGSSRQGFRVKPVGPPERITIHLVCENATEINEAVKAANAELERWHGHLVGLPPIDIMISGK